MAARRPEVHVMDLQEVSDRMEIQDLIQRYSAAVDERRWEDLTELFTGDAFLDYTATGGIAGTLADHQAYDAEVLVSFKRTQHLMGLPAIVVDGDIATARTNCFNPMVVSGERVFFVGLLYADVLVRTGTGWRFRERRQELAYVHDP